MLLEIDFRNRLNGSFKLFLAQTVRQNFGANALHFVSENLSGRGSAELLFLFRLVLGASLLGGGGRRRTSLLLGCGGKGNGSLKLRIRLTNVANSGYWHVAKQLLC